MSKKRESDELKFKLNLKKAKADEEEVEDEEDEEAYGDPNDMDSDEEATHTEGFNDFSDLELKPNHASRPVWVTPDYRIFLETYSPIYKQAYDFVITIAEPVCRPRHIHEYHITSSSLNAAMSLGFNAEYILNVLGRLCKTKLPPQLERYVKKYTQTYGKAKLVLKQNRYFIETIHEDVLHDLERNPVICNAHPDNFQEDDFVMPKYIPSHLQGLPHEELVRRLKADASKAALAASQSAATKEEVVNELPPLDLTGDDDDEEKLYADKATVHSLEIHTSQAQAVRKECRMMGYPLTEEYDFHGDKVNADIGICLKPTTSIRPYQEKGLSKVFHQGRARSGIIVLPCGAGKTLVGITALCTVKKSCLILATNGVSVTQWRREVLKWANIGDDVRISRFTAEHKEECGEGSSITITTYSMLSCGKLSKQSRKILDQLKSREWGLVLLDEVHVVPADMFRKAIDFTAHCKLGLTATLVREDDKIDDLSHLIGPKLYEANWIDLAEAGFLANVQCVEVWCPMTAEFYREYLTATARKQMLLWVMNPNKLRACQYLIDHHSRNNDKIIVFSDNVFALKTCAMKLGKPYICGDVSHSERLVILNHFQHDPNVNCIFLSKVGDTSIDIPEANVIIQISSHFGSRRQEAQRLGRILRAKQRVDSNFNAFFYSLVSRDTQEMYYSTKRQQFLVDQGYSFKVVQKFPGMESFPYEPKEKQLEMLSTVLQEDDASAVTEDVSSSTKKKQFAARRNQTSMSEISGGAGQVYAEVEASSIRKPVTSARKKIAQGMRGRR